MTKKFLFFVTTICLLFFTIVFFTVTDTLNSDDYYELLLRMSEVNRAKQTARIDLNAKQDEQVNSTDSSNNSIGLNLLLIDELTESYAKDILSCLRNSEQGVYDNYTLRLTVPASCGLQNAETGLYPGTSLLKSYLPFEDGKPVWNKQYKNAAASEMTLEQYDNTVEKKAGHYSGIDHGNTVTVFQYDYWESRRTKAKVDGAGNASRTKGDRFFYPDVLATNNKYITDFVTGSSINNAGLNFKSISQDIVSSDWLAFMYATAHNRGESGSINYMFGARMGAGTSKVNVNAITDEQKLDITNSFVSLYSDYRKEYPDNYDVAKLLSGSDTYNWVTAMLVTHSSDWYYSDNLSKYLKNNIGTCVKFWNALYPDEKLTDKELTLKIDGKVSTFPAILKKVNGVEISSSDCEKVYGSSTDGDEYKLSGWPSWDGFVFKVTNIKSKAYKNKYSDGSTPYVIHCMDLICAKEAVSACFGDVVYAKMLYYAGLGNVDPTNPDTYYNEETDFVPTGNLDWLKLYGVDEKSLSGNQKNLLATAYNIVNLNNCTYAHLDASASDGGTEVRTMKDEYYKNKKPTELDCSGFVCRAYKDSGFTGFSSYMSTSILISSSSKYFECITPAELRPGDILVRNDGRKGHTMIYLSGYTEGSDKVVCIVMESNTMKNVTYNRDGPNIRVLGGTYEYATDTAPKTNGKYYCLRLKTFDTDTTQEKKY